jgi:hypothetical protein
MKKSNGSGDSVFHAFSSNAVWEFGSGAKKPFVESTLQQQLAQNVLACCFCQVFIGSLATKRIRIRWGLRLVRWTPRSGRVSGPRLRCCSAAGAAADLSLSWRKRSTDVWPVSEWTVRLHSRSARSSSTPAGPRAFTQCRAKNSIGVRSVSAHEPWFTIPPFRSFL